METKIKEWLSKSGYPLELRTEKILRRIGFSVFNSEPYDDPETKVKREIDLLAEKSLMKEDITVSIQFIVECKKSTNPFIVLEASKHPFNSFSLFTNYYSSHRMSHPSFFSRKGFKINLPKKHCTGFKIVQGFSNSDETLFKAGYGLSKAFYFYLENEAKLIDYYIDDQVYSVYIPLLVIDAPFYSAALDENLGIELKQIESAIWRSHQISADEDDFSIIVVSIENLESLTKRIINTANSYLKFIIENESCRLEKEQKLKAKKKKLKKVKK